ncbi:hypothetical protein NQ318_004307 [Aromia moschata]|uniref:SPIN90/Ldb17 leucine-rich domain-containing protein n=1 Tax=Aromia moschata TaxID=1265417 RepID=A0AAV8YT12_9CUCU|nr:hypothetical protein NQ318_004307 [Aromia moschata]
MEINHCEENRLKDSEITRSNNISAADLDEETNNRLRGDAIGDTLYSQSFVLKTLLQFSHLQWGEEVEEDLCFLWDMTVEKDVCKYLFELSFPSLTCAAVTKYSENRFTEIIIGILANILCAECDKHITEEEIKIILNELDTDDPLILIQIMRFINATAHMSKDLPFISETVIDKIKFILCNSTNSDLLLKTLEVVAKLTTDFKLNRGLVNIGLIEASLIAYQLLMADNESEVFEMDTRSKQLTCRYFLEVVSNVCVYFDQSDDKSDLLQFKRHSNVFVDEVFKIVDYFSYEENLLPITDDIIFYMSVFRFVSELLDVAYRSDLFLSLTKILYVILDIEEEIVEMLEPVVELECFLLFRGNPRVVCNDLKKLPREHVKNILKAVSENKNKYDFMLDVEYLLEMYK